MKERLKEIVLKFIIIFTHIYCFLLYYLVIYKIYGNFYYYYYYYYYYLLLFFILIFFLGCSLESQGHVRRPYVAVVIRHPYVYTYTKNNRIYKMKKLQPPKSKG